MTKLILPPRNPGETEIHIPGGDLPVDWDLRRYQYNVWEALFVNKFKRVALVWHRRAGKDILLLAWTIIEALTTPGTYWHLFPTAKQGRKILWDGVTKDGRPFLGLWPRQAIAQRNDADMKLKLHNGSVWQIVGTENYNEALVGGNPRGLVFSEYALQDPGCWEFLRPILAENGGKAAFAFTPRGSNHGEDLFNMAAANPNWYAERLTIDDTGAMPADSISEERKAGMPEELIQQEFYCSFSAALTGAYYGRQMEAAGIDGRITSVEPERGVRVETWWDLGVRDSTAIWFVQRVGYEVRIIDYYEASGESLAHYADVLRERGYVYDKHIFPHDIAVRELGTGRARIDMLHDLGVTGATARSVISPNLPVADGINAVRMLLPHCWFDAVKCARGIQALKAYAKNWNEKTRRYESQPIHNWASHAADAFRYGALMTQPVVEPQLWETVTTDNDWDVFK